jgi:hypothetical protein
LEIWNVWLEAFAPWTQEGEREAGFLEMVGDIDGWKETSFERSL